MIGGGPAGLAAAIAARQRGFQVALADCAPQPIEKACGEGLLPEGVAALRELGITAAPEQSFLFRGIRFAENGMTVEADFPQGPGVGMRRRALHQMLVGRAAELGVEMHWGTRVAGEMPQCRWIVGADGQNSRVRDWAGLDRYRRNTRRFGFRRHFRIAPWSEYMEVHWGQDCQLFITPVAPDEVCIAVLTRDSTLRLDQALTLFPAIAKQLAGARQTTPEKGRVTASCRLEKVFQGRIALAGDAAGSHDAITGQGLSNSFQQAIALADSLVKADLSGYETAQRQMNRAPAIMAGLMLALERHGWMRRQVWKTFAARPGLFKRLVAIHTRAGP